MVFRLKWHGYKWELGTFNAAYYIKNALAVQFSKHKMSPTRDSDELGKPPQGDTTLNQCFRVWPKTYGSGFTPCGAHVVIYYISTVKVYYIA